MDGCKLCVVPGTNVLECKVKAGRVSQREGVIFVRSLMETAP